MIGIRKRFYFKDLSQFVGSLLSVKFFKGNSGWKILLLSLFLGATGELFVPFAKNLWLLILCTALPSFAMSWIEVGLSFQISSANPPDIKKDVLSF
jgi:hypothetical protein